MVDVDVREGDEQEDLMITAGASHGLDLVLGTIGAEQRVAVDF